MHKAEIFMRHLAQAHTAQRLLDLGHSPASVASVFNDANEPAPSGRSITWTAPRVSMLLDEVGDCPASVGEACADYTMTGSHVSVSS